MGDRCLLLRGNHELIRYEDNQIKSAVNPSGTTIFLNDTYASEPSFCEQFVEYFSSLPIYCIVNSAEKRFLLVHGGITRDAIMNDGGTIAENGEIVFQIKTQVEKEGEETPVSVMIDEDKKGQLLNQMLLSMMWADPHEYKKKLQSGSSRFEFGAEQFERFMSEANLDILIRSHEPEESGVKEFYGGRLYTIFSSGGEGNPDSEYSDFESACCVKTPKYIVIDSTAEISIKDIY